MNGLARPPSEPEPRAGWESRILLAALGVGFAIALEVANDHGFGGLFEWSLIFVVGAGLAIAVFWHRRKTHWYWPAVFFIVAVHVAALALNHWHLLGTPSTGTAMALKAAIGGDFAASALFFYVLHLLFDPEAGPWTHTTKFFVAAFIVFNVGVFGVGALVLYQAHKTKIEHLRLVAQRPSTQSMDQLMDCLDSYRIGSHEWEDPKIGVPARQVFNGIARLRVVDQGASRLVQMEKIDGTPPTYEERALIARCSG